MKCHPQQTHSQRYWQMETSTRPEPETTSSHPQVSFVPQFLQWILWHGSKCTIKASPLESKTQGGKPNRQPIRFQEWASLSHRQHHQKNSPSHSEPCCLLQLHILLLNNAKLITQKQMPQVDCHHQRHIHQVPNPPPTLYSLCTLWPTNACVKRRKQVRSSVIFSIC